MINLKNQVQNLSDLKDLVGKEKRGIKMMKVVQDHCCK